MVQSVRPFLDFFWRSLEVVLGGANIIIEIAKKKKSFTDLRFLGGCGGCDALAIHLFLDRVSRGRSLPREMTLFWNFLTSSQHSFYTTILKFNQQPNPPPSPPPKPKVTKPKKKSKKCWSFFFPGKKNKRNVFPWDVRRKTTGNC